MTWHTALFDLDGTISNPLEGIHKSINHALLAFGHDAVTSAQVRSMIGPPLTEIFESILGPVDEANMIGLIDTYRERYADVGYTENIVYEGIPDMIHSLHDAGLRMGVCTSKRADYAGRIIDMFGLGDYFLFVDGGDVHITKATQIERLVASGIDATKTVMIGDRAVDIDAARRNSVASIGVAWGFGDHTELDQANADHIVHSPRELLECLL